MSRDKIRASASTGLLAGISVMKGSPNLSTDPGESLATVSTIDASGAVSQTRSSSLLITVLITLKFLDGLLDLRIVAVDLRLVLTASLIIKLFLQGPHTPKAGPLAPPRCA